MIALVLAFAAVAMSGVALAVALTDNHTQVQILPAKTGSAYAQP